MKAAGIIILAAMLAAKCPAGECLHATLEATTNRPGWFVIHITNVSSNSIRFLDLREGSGMCGEFYEVTVETDGKRHTSEGRCFYAPVSVPHIVEVAAGETYKRDIQPIAYLGSSVPVTPRSQFTVTYRLSPRVKDQWKGKASEADLDLMFNAASQKIIEQ